jgi:hypothetical protein
VDKSFKNICGAFFHHLNIIIFWQGMLNLVPSNVGIQLKDKTDAIIPENSDIALMSELLDSRLRVTKNSISLCSSVETF